MSSSRQHFLRWGITFAVFFGTALFFTSIDPVRQARAADDDDEPEATVNHAECTMFTTQRDRIARGSLRTPGDGSYSLVTEEVVSALPSPAPLPSRSRTGALRDTIHDNYIDTHIFTVLRARGIPPAGPATDLEFLRRVTLDLTGRIPRAVDVANFLNDPRPSDEKRAAWIDALLDSPEWADKWAMFFGDLYRNTINTAQLPRYQPGRDAYHYYILDSLRVNKPYNVMASELITGTGDSFQAGQANFPLTGRTTGGPVQDTFDTQGVDAASMFLGLAQLDCITCHDGAGHLDSLSLWGARAKREEALGMAAFFAHTDLDRVAGTDNNRAWFINDARNANRNYQLNTTTGNRPPRRPINGRAFVAPAYIFGGGPNGGENWRAALARLVTSDFQFARATTNHIWRKFMVAGLVEPPDQFDPLRLNPNNPPPAPWTLQPSNPQLLDALSRNFIANEYNLKTLMREITTSRAYQLSSRYDGTWNPEWERYYARKLVRRLEAEEMHDAIVLSSGVMGGYVMATFREPRIDFAMQLPDVVGLPGGAGGQLLDAFTRGNRFDDERRSDLNSLQALNLMNNTFVYNRARNTAGTLLNRIINLPNDELIDHLHLNILSRPPTAAEKASALKALTAGPRVNKAEDLNWSLYNKVDFIFNY